jgi:tetratricopeptide (TPR) repeat protein
MSTARFVVSVFALFACLSPLGCKALKQAVGDRISPAPSASAAVALGRPATEQEAAAFALRLQEALKTNQNLGTLIGIDQIVARGFSDLGLPSTQADAAARAAAEKFGEGLQLALKAGGTYKLLGNRVIDGERRVKFRLLQADNAFNYHDYVVVTNGGKQSAVDVHILTTGEPLSGSLRRSLLPVAVELKKGLIARLTTKESAYVENMPTILKMTKLQTDPKGALAAYASLPAVLKTDKNVLTLRVQAASMVDDAAYLAAMEDFRRAFPNDPAIGVMSIDYFYLKKMHKEAIEQVSAVEKVTGPDAHLNSLRAGIHSELGAIDPAKKELETALALEPDLPEAVQLAIALDLATRDETAALAKIKDASSRNVALGRLQENPDYIAFIARRDVKKKLEAAATK